MSSFPCPPSPSLSRVALLFALLVLAGCAHRYQVAPLHPRAPVDLDPMEVRVLSVEEGTPRGGIQVGRFRLSPIGEKHLDSLAMRLRRDAAKLGGNLLVIHSAVDSVEGEIWHDPRPNPLDRDSGEVYLFNEPDIEKIEIPFEGRLTLNRVPACEFLPGTALRVRFRPGSDTLKLNNVRVPSPPPGGRRYFRVTGPSGSSVGAVALTLPLGLRLGEIPEFRFKTLPLNPIACAQGDGTP